MSTPDALTFECPLTERARTWLRLEELFGRTRVFAARKDSIDHRSALLGLFHIVDTAGRNDLKTDLLQELDRVYSCHRRIYSLVFWCKTKGRAGLPHGWNAAI